MSVNTPLEATPVQTLAVPAVPVEHSNAGYHKVIQGLAVTTVEAAPVPQPKSEARGNRNSEPIKQYKAGTTDVLEIERQYLGAWDRSEA